MVPAMRVLRPSVAKRVMARMAYWPAGSLAQWSVWPAPSEVTTPSPVTTTIGRPILSLVDGILCSPSANPFDQSEGFASPMSDTGHHDLAQFGAHWAFQPGRVAGWEQITMAERDRGQRHIHGELRFQPMPEIGTGGAYGKVAMALQEGALLGGRGQGTGGAGKHRGVADFDLTLDLVPQPRERRDDRARPARGAVGEHGCKARQRLGAARLGMVARLDHQEGAKRAEDETAMVASLPDRRLAVLQIETAEFVEHQQVGPLAVM